MTEDSCPWSIRWGVFDESVTRCDKTAGHGGPHEGPGLPEFSYQRIEWFPGDRREYQ